MFDDTSTQQVGYGGQQPGYPGFNPAQLANDPMANMAFQYGTSLASQGKDYVDKNVRFYLTEEFNSSLIVVNWKPRSPRAFISYYTVNGQIVLATLPLAIFVFVGPTV